MSELIKLPSERVEQLRMLSNARGMPVADLIAEFVREQQDRGVIPRGIPGIEVKRMRRHVVVDFGVFAKNLDLDLARAFATALRWMAAPRRSSIAEAFVEAGMALSGAPLVGLSRRGTSVKISEGAAERTLAPSIAVDLANLIEAAAQ